MTDQELMQLAIEQARLAGNDEVPVGAIIVDTQGQVIAAGFNNREQSHDPTGHAEIVAIRSATKKLGDWRLENTTLVVTLEPCVMCAGAIVAARIPKVIFGAFDERVGASGSAYDILRDGRLGNPVEVVAPVWEEQCGDLLRDFFQKKRDL